MKNSAQIDENADPDNALPKTLFVWSNPWMAGHFVRSF